MSSRQTSHTTDRRTQTNAFIMLRNHSWLPALPNPAGFAQTARDFHKHWLQPKCCFVSWIFIQLPSDQCSLRISRKVYQAYFMTFCFLAYLVLQKCSINVKFSFQINTNEDNVLFCFHDPWAVRLQSNTKKQIIQINLSSDFGIWKGNFCL